MDMQVIFKEANALRGTDAFALDENGTCSILMGSDLAVRFLHVPETDELLTIARVGGEPTEGAEWLHQAMLRAMFMFKGTGGASLTVDEETQDIVLIRRDDLAALDAERFLARLDDFAAVARTWQETILSFGPTVREAKREVADMRTDGNCVLSGEFIKI